MTAKKSLETLSVAGGVEQAMRERRIECTNCRHVVPFSSIISGHGFVGLPGRGVVTYDGYFCSSVCLMEYVDRAPAVAPKVINKAS